MERGNWAQELLNNKENVTNNFMVPVWPGKEVKESVADQYEGERWFFPFPDDEESGDLIERVIDARCAYWTSRPVTKDELPPDVRTGAPIE